MFLCWEQGDLFLLNEWKQFLTPLAGSPGGPLGPMSPFNPKGPVRPWKNQGKPKYFLILAGVCNVFKISLWVHLKWNSLWVLVVLLVPSRLVHPERNKCIGGTAETNSSVAAVNYTGYITYFVPLLSSQSFLSLQGKIKTSLLYLQDMTASCWK